MKYFHKKEYRHWILDYGFDNSTTEQLVEHIEYVLRYLHENSDSY